MSATKEERFKKQVLSKYQIYNSIFMTLPFDDIMQTGVLLPLFQQVCIQGFERSKNPTEIVNHFFKTYTDQPSEEEKTALLFKIIQYVERQVVLFDAIEDATFSIINNMDGRGTLRNVREEAEDKNKKEALQEYLKRFKVRPVLTAHPTQFYPGTVLGIITDLDTAIQNNDLEAIKSLLAQLGKTPFFKKKKPSPYDEAVSLIWYLENIFYHSASNIFEYIQNNIFEGIPIQNDIVHLGFWPGGDRDGNPFVTTEITLKVAQRLQQSIFKNYYKDLRKLKRRITFVGAEERVAKLEEAIFNALNHPEKKPELTVAQFLKELNDIISILEKEHQSLFVDKVRELRNKIQLFGFHFASLDIRQDSRVHTHVMTQIAEDHPKLFSAPYASMSDAEKIQALASLKGAITPQSLSDEMAQKTLGSIYAMKEIQQRNGELGCHRYIISNN